MPPLIPVHLHRWLASHINLALFSVDAIVPEASTRQFWRLQSPTASLVAMLSPPETENNDQFCQLSDTFIAANVPVPHVYAKDLTEGYLLVSDVGKHDFSGVYATPQRKEAVLAALDVLLDIQQIHSDHIPPYTRDRLHMELGIFSEWVCEKLLQIGSQPLKAIENHLLDQIESQPQLTVHRDFHSRNLLFTDPHHIGIVDFQDALFGPATYDLASLLYDCYYEFEAVERENYLQHFREEAKARELGLIEPLNALRGAVEYCAIQRQLKAVGIFCRLVYLQQKTTHLKFVVPVLKRVRKLAMSYQPFEAFGQWLDSEVIPGCERHLPTLRALT